MDQTSRWWSECPVRHWIRTQSSWSATGCHTLGMGPRLQERMQTDSFRRESTRRRRGAALSTPGHRSVQTEAQLILLVNTSWPTRRQQAEQRKALHASQAIPSGWIRCSTRNPATPTPRRLSSARNSFSCVDRATIFFFVDCHCRSRPQYDLVGGSTERAAICGRAPAAFVVPAEPPDPLRGAWAATDCSMCID